MTQLHPYAAFSGYGIEIEHMIVDAESLDVLPIADRLLDAVGGAEDMDVLRGEAAWSNELALHVIETKTAGPIADLGRATQVFRTQITEIEALLEPLGGRLLPTGMHPWMDPLRETLLWPHQNDEIYRTFDRIFDCKGHGWSNLQSTHINFPFSNEHEFARVHAACRFVLPLLPALAASSPFCEGVRTRELDARLFAYRTNCARVPSVTGVVVPERVFSRSDYETLLRKIYDDLAPFDPEGVLSEEWVNARGCIARFDRGAIEIRVLDTQECPEQDVAVVEFVTRVVQNLAEGAFVPVSALMEWDERRLAAILERSIVFGGAAALEDAAYAEAFGSRARFLRDLLGELVETVVPVASPRRQGLDRIVALGCLAERIVARVESGGPGREALREVYREIADCLSTGRVFLP